MGLMLRLLPLLLTMALDGAPDTSDADDAPDDGDAPDRDDAPDTGDAPGTNGGNKNTGRLFTQADVDRIVNERLDRERRRQEDQRLEEQEEYRELAETRLARIRELEPLEERVERLEAALERHLEAEREGLPDHILTLLDRMDVDEQLAYLAEHRDTLKPTGTVRGIRDTRPQTPEGPPPSASKRYIENRYRRGRQG